MTNAWAISVSNNGARITATNQPMRSAPVGIHIGVVDARGEPEQQQREQFCGEGHDEQQDGEPPPCHVSQCYAPAVQEAGHTAGVCRA